MEWLIVNFGIYEDEDKTLPEIILENPDYFLFCFEKDIFKYYDDLKFQAEELYSKIRAIKIPENHSPDLVCEYLNNSKTGIINTIQLNYKDARRDDNCVYRESYIDLAFPREFNPDAKRVTNKLLPQLFFILFGDRDVLLSKTMCENFFSDDYNFNV